MGGVTTSKHDDPMEDDWKGSEPEGEGDGRD